MDSDMQEAKDKKKIDIKGKEFDSKNLIDVEPTLDEEQEENSLIEAVCDEELQEVMDRMQRRKAGISARKNKHKMKRGREKAMRKTATMEVLKKRARKAAIQKLKAKFSKNRRYAELGAGEKEVIDKRIAKIAKSRIDMMAKKLIPGIKIKERQRKMNANVREDVNEQTMVCKDCGDEFGKPTEGNGCKNDSSDLNASCWMPKEQYSEASLKDQRVMKRPHMLLSADKKPKLDARFRMFKKKEQVQESTMVDELLEIAQLMEATEALDIEEMDVSVKSITKSGFSNLKKANNYSKLKSDIKAMRDRLNKNKGMKPLKAGYESVEEEKDSLATLANKEQDDKKKKGEIKRVPKKDEDEKKKDLDAAFESFIESCGAGEEGTPELTKKLKKDTPDA
tara:strand:- start:9851 stop:11032 length:1182 start_codon:yes stop_codon:yes gene_type:complete